MTENSTVRQPANTIKFNYKQNFFSSLELLNSYEKNHWVWLDCNYFLKYSPDKKNISYLNLTPFHKIHNIMGSVQTTLAHPKVEITMEKNIIFDNSLGWNWHKSWILPMITVRLLNHQDYDLEENKIFAKLFVVKAGLQETETFYLVDIGIKGENKIYLKNNVASFNNLKFASTSYNNEGLKFHLVVALFYEINNASDFSSTSNLRIIESKLSPPIYVDSRKSARDNITTEIKIFDFFSPDLLVKPLVKRRKKEGDISEEMITNSFKGFINYYTAANIRNKVKHPFFPALRFSNSISLYYNKEYFKNMDLETIVEKMLMLLNKLNENMPMKEAKPKKGKNKIIINNINENAYLTIFIKNPKDTNFSKKVAEFLTSFDQRVINIVCNSNQNLSKFEEITDLGLLTTVYKSVYEKNATNSANPEEDDEGDDETEKSFRTSSSNIKPPKPSVVGASSSNLQTGFKPDEGLMKKGCVQEFTLGQSSTQKPTVDPITAHALKLKQENIQINTKVEIDSVRPPQNNQSMVTPTQNTPNPNQNSNQSNNPNASGVKMEDMKNVKNEETALNAQQQELLSKMANMQGFPNPFLSMMSGQGNNSMAMPPMFNPMGGFNNFQSFMNQNNPGFPFPNSNSLPNQSQMNALNAMNNLNNMSNPLNNMNSLANMNNMNAMGMSAMMGRMFPQNSNQMTNMPNMPSAMMNFNQQNPMNSLNFLNHMANQNRPNMPNFMENMQQKNPTPDAMTMNKNLMMQQMQQLSNMGNPGMANPGIPNPGMSNNGNNQTTNSAQNNNNNNQNNMFMNLSQMQAQARKAQLNDLMMYNNFL